MFEGYRENDTFATRYACAGGTSKINVKDKELLRKYWEDHYKVNGPNPGCSLCGNTGVVDTTDTAITTAGKKIGRKNYCFCPKGVEFRKKPVK